jgi:hypothetical protein
VSKRDHAHKQPARGAIVGVSAGLRHVDFADEPIELAPTDTLSAQLGPGDAVTIGVHRPPPTARPSPWWNNVRRAWMVTGPDGAPVLADPQPPALADPQPPAPLHLAGHVDTIPITIHVGPLVPPAVKVAL